MTEGSSQDNSQGQVGEYVLDHEIGKGSFALVYRAHHISKPEQLVAVKSVVRQKLSPKLLENLEGEISILKSMRHTNIVDLRFSRSLCLRCVFFEVRILCIAI